MSDKQSIDELCQAVEEMLDMWVSNQKHPNPLEVLQRVDVALKRVAKKPHGNWISHPRPIIVGAENTGI